MWLCVLHAYQHNKAFKGLQLQQRRQHTVKENIFFLANMPKLICRVRIDSTGNASFNTTWTQARIRVAVFDNEHRLSYCTVLPRFS